MLGGMLTGLPADAAVDYTPEVTGYASVTINVYDSATDNLFNADDVMVHFCAATEEGLEKGVGVGLDAWTVTESNPRVRDKVPVSPEWLYYFELSWNSYDNYYYTITDIEWDLPFTLENDEDKVVDVYLKKNYRPGVFNSCFVYLGRDNDNRAEFMQFFPVDDDAPNVFRRKQLTYLGELGEDVQYGDMFETDDEVVTTGAVDGQYLEPLENLNKTGNIADKYGKTTYRVLSTKTKTGLEPSLDTLTLSLTSDNDDYITYSIRLKDLDFPFSFDNIRQNDTVEFYNIDSTILLPASQYVHEPQFMGDLNYDRLLTVADVVLMQKWLLGSDDVKIEDWTAVDYCKDGVLDVYDLCLVRQALIEELSIPRATMAVHVTYGGYGIAGQDLGHGEFDMTYTVRKGDWYVELNNGEWLRNEKYIRNGDSAIIRITDVTEEGVTFVSADTEALRSEHAVKEYFLKFGEEQHFYTTTPVVDGTNYDYDVTFTEFLAPIGKKQR